MTNPRLKQGSRVLVTGGAGFIGGCLIRRLIKMNDVEVFNIDKLGYASDLCSIQLCENASRHQLVKADLADKDATRSAIHRVNPDVVMHLAAETHVDRSIDDPEAFTRNNVIGTLNLLEAIRDHFQDISDERKSSFVFHHISTDEVFGSLDDKGFFSELSRYEPRSPYSASKASSDHLVNAWHHTYKLPVIITNCSNNFGPWQFPEKLIPLAIIKGLSNDQIPLYGDGMNVRDWLFVEDHIDALILTVSYGKVGESYCIGGYGERTNKEVLKAICELLDNKTGKEDSYSNLIKLVTDRPGHDRRYAIDSSKISDQLNWKPKHTFEQALEITFDWYLNNLEWTKRMLNRNSYNGKRLGLLKD